jgi:uncharacterized protein (TIGR00299 family) protein
MTLAALIDAGWPLEELQAVVAKLELPGVSVTAKKVNRGGLSATHVNVSVQDEARTRHRHLPEILQIIEEAELPSGVTDRATKVFTRLAQAEAQVHGTSVGQVHFHEVGAADAIVDIVGACAGFEAMKLERVYCSPIPPGTGTVKCEHGELPVPAPATAELLVGVPLAECDEVGELTTPTGAAILTTVAQGFGPLPAMRVEAIGHGAGTRENRSRPNILRVFIGELAPEEEAEQERMVVLEAQVDDAPGQVVAHACERLLEAGALDAFIVPIIMKKGRPGQLLTALAHPQDVVALEAVIFRETTTLGIRRHTCDRSRLAREYVVVETRYGPVRVKVGRRGSQVQQAWPEYEDCAAAARDHDAALRDVQDAALHAWLELKKHDRNDRSV